MLKPTNSPSDRVVWIPIEAVYRMSGHVLRGTGQIYRPTEGEEIPDENKEVSAVMLKFKNAQTGFILDQQINRQGKSGDAGVARGEGDGGSCSIASAG